MPKDFSIRPSSPLTWCAPSPRSVLSSLLICSTGHLLWYAPTTCLGVHSSRLVTRIFVCFGPTFRPFLLSTTVTSPMCRRHRRVLYIQKVLPDSPGFSGKIQAIDIVDVICDQSGDQMLSNCRVETGKQGLSCPHHLRA